MLRDQIRHRLVLHFQCVQQDDDVTTPTGTLERRNTISVETGEGLKRFRFYPQREDFFTPLANLYFPQLQGVILRKLSGVKTIKNKN